MWTGQKDHNTMGRLQGGCKNTPPCSLPSSEATCWTTRKICPLRGLRWPPPDDQLSADIKASLKPLQMSPPGPLTRGHVLLPGAGRLKLDKHPAAGHAHCQPALTMAADHIQEVKN
jgi:hypothetical protein